MSEQPNLDRVFHIIMKRMVATGQAPHYTEIASALDVPVEEGRKALHKLFKAGIPGWLFPILCLSDHESLPVGRAHPELGQV